MSLYTNQIKTHIIDPVYFGQDRCEFKFTPNKLFMSNMRLGGAGYVPDTVATDIIQNPAGVWGQIKNIFLMDGGTEIDKQYDVGPLMAFKASNHPNDQNYSKNKSLTQSFLGYESNSDRILSAPFATINTNSQSLSKTGWLSLLDVFDYLKNSIYVSTNMFSHLRLVIEFYPVKTAEPQGKSILKPYLIVDEIVDEKAMESIEKELMNTPIVFKPIERDSALIPVILASTPQNVNLKLKGFNGKTLNRVLVCKSTATNVSLSIDSEKVNFVVNGRQILPYDGIDTPSKRTMYLNDSWGTVNMLPAQNNVIFPAGKKATFALLQANDFIGLGINENVREFELQYSRNTANVASLVALNLLVYGEVNKVFNPNGGDYKILYL